MKAVLKLLAAAIFLFMLTVTIRATLAQSLPAAWPAYAASPWAMATLWDAYSGFTLFWIWVAFREKSWPGRIVWLVLIYALGNIATAAYFFIALMQLRSDEPADRAGAHNAILHLRTLKLTAPSSCSPRQTSASAPQSYAQA